MKKVLQAVSDNRVTAYVIWDPISGGDFDGEARKLSNSFPDKRVSYFKDPNSLSGMLWKRVLKLDREIAWDVYLLYGVEAQWDKEPPQPYLWMHQLAGVTIAPIWDEDKFTEEIKGVLNRLEPKESKREKR